jgi:pentatricopeptide repeat protein
VSPSLHHLGGAIAALAKTGADHRRACALLRELPQPDVYCYGWAVAACARDHRPDVAVQLLTEMRQQGLQVRTAVCISVVVASIAQTESLAIMYCDVLAQHDS